MPGTHGYVTTLNKSCDGTLVVHIKALKFKSKRNGVLGPSRGVTTQYKLVLVLCTTSVPRVPRHVRKIYFFGTWLVHGTLCTIGVP